MKRNSNSNDQDGQLDSEPDIHKNLRDGSPVGPSNTGSFDDLESWSREDFEAALPLYVGGDLDAQEAARVDAWLIAHPEDQGTLAASKQAAGVLARYAEFTKERETPDLWAGIRSELKESGLIESGTLETASAGHAPGPQGQKASSHERPILGGPRWFQRKSVAMAAAVLLTGSFGLSLMSRGAGGGSGEMTTPSMASTSSIAASGVDAELTSPTAVDSRSSEMAFLPGEGLLGGEMGTPGRPLASTPVGDARPARAPMFSRGKAQKLQLAQQGAERLIDDAPKALLWQSDPWVETNQGLLRSTNGTQLTGGR